MVKNNFTRRFLKEEDDFRLKFVSSDSPKSAGNLVEYQQQSFDTFLPTTVTIRCKNCISIASTTKTASFGRFLLLRSQRCQTSFCRDVIRKSILVRAKTTTFVAVCSGVRLNGTCLYCVIYLRSPLP